MNKKITRRVTRKKPKVIRQVSIPAENTRVVTPKNAFANTLAKLFSKLM